MQGADWHRQILTQVANLAGGGRPPGQALDAILDVMLSHRLQQITERLFHVTGGVVQSGPFVGMHLLPLSAGSLLAPRLLGCYEEELHPVWFDAARRGYESMVNVGCGEGYYAVGLARLLPAARVHAFDSAAPAQELCRQLADRNGVSGRVTVGGACGPADLAALARPRTLLVCDAEGAERTLLDPAVVSGLEVCDIVVELHDFLDAGVSHDVPARFVATHDVTLIHQTGRDPNALPLVQGWGQFDQALAVLEGRPGPTPWALLRARS
jgi:hypothetical protein